MQPCFTPAWQVKDSVNLLSILTAHLSFEYMDIKTSKKRPWTPSFLSLSDSFWQGIQSKAFLKSTKREKSKFRCFCGLDFMYLSIRIFNVEDAVNCAMHFSQATLFSFQNSFLDHITSWQMCRGWGGGEGLARLELTYMNQLRDMGAIKCFPFSWGFFSHLTVY